MSRHDTPSSRGLKRHPALVALSRDHHFALRQALWLKRAGGATTAEAAARAARRYVEFHDGALAGHVSDEEDVLLPRAGHVDPAGAERIRAEHRRLYAATRALQEALECGADPRPLARQIGQLLDDHVRFEERSFFMEVQDGLSPEALGDLETALREARAAGPGRPCEDDDRAG